MQNGPPHVSFCGWLWQEILLKELHAFEDNQQFLLTAIEQYVSLPFPLPSLLTRRLRV